MKSSMRILLILFFLFLHDCIYANAYVSNCNAASSSIDLDVNNVRAKLLNGGDMFWTLFSTRESAYEIPKNSGKHSSFASAIWMSGIDDGGNLLSAAQTYRQRGIDFWPGPLDNTGQTNSKICKEWDKMFSVYGTEINNVINKKGISFNVAKWPSNFAPFYDNNSDGIYDPSYGDYPVIDIYKPNVIPGQMVFWIFNDAGNTHTNYFNSIPFEVEVHATAYAFASNQSDAINNSTMYKYKIINKSSFTYFDYRVAKYMDHDLGEPVDDYVGCDVGRELFYTYNNSNFDKVYGTNPPAFGMQVLNSDKNDNNEKLGMGSFFVPKYVPDIGLPIQDWYPLFLYRMMRGFWDDGTFMAYGTFNGVGNSNPCKFMFPENTDPEGRPYWVETVPQTGYDRKMVASTNSKTLLPGAITHFEFAMVWAQDSQASSLQSVEKLKRTADTVLQAYKTNFNSFSTGIQTNFSKFNIYPNPTSNYIIIKGLIEKSTLKIYNQEGKLMLQKIIYVDERIDVSGLPTGIYFMQIAEVVHRFVKIQ